MEEETGTIDVPPAGERLRAAREEKGVSLEEIASETRIPLRHLENLETGDWDRLPAPTYTIGFAKSYAGAVGLDPGEIGEQLRNEMGGYRSNTATVEHFEPVDPARTMPRWLVLGAIVAIVLVVLVFTWIRNSALDEEPEIPEQTIAERPETAAPPVAGSPAAANGISTNPNGPVVLTATEPAWIQVRDQGRTLFEGILNTGQTYQVPPTATSPVLKAGKPEALRVTVGNEVAPPVGPAGQVTSNVSLQPADLMRTEEAQGQPQQGQQPQNSLAQ